MSALAGNIDNMDWPEPDDYDWAIQHRQTAFYDPMLQRGATQERAGRPIRLNGGGSKYICVYRVGDWVVRCFAAKPPNIYPPAGILQRYRGITSYLSPRQQELPFLARHTWFDRGVNINGKDLPILKVPFIQGGVPLGDFLMDYNDNTDFRRIVASLANQWLYIVHQLEATKIAHGDLDLTNILVYGTSPAFSLILIDFDGMYVPTLAKSGLGVADNGHAHFQPVNPALRTFGPTMDRFSALIIYLSLCGLARNPSLWENCEAEENRALLGVDDFRRLNVSKNFARLRQETDNAELQMCLDELRDSMMQERMPRSLDEVLSRSAAILPADPQTEAPRSSYGGRAVPLPIPGSEARVTAEMRAVPPPTEPEKAAAEPANASPNRPTRTPASAPSQAPSRSGNSGWVPIVIILMILVIIGVLWLYSTTQTHSSTSGFVVVQLQLLMHALNLSWIPESIHVAGRW